MTTLFIRNNGRKLSRQLLSLVRRNQNSNNYEDTHIRVAISEKSIKVSTLCHNSSDSWYNDNDTEVSFSNIPYFTSKKLGLV